MKASEPLFAPMFGSVAFEYAEIMKSCHPAARSTVNVPVLPTPAEVYCVPSMMTPECVLQACVKPQVPACASLT